MEAVDFSRFRFQRKSTASSFLIPAQKAAPKRLGQIVPFRVPLIQHCLNNIWYVDDICCIAPSCKGLQKLLDVCYEYAQSHDISFNCSKTKIMMFKTKFLKLNFVPKIQLGNCVIDYVEKGKYLGLLLTCDLRDDIDMYRQLRYVYGTANRLRSKFSDCSKNIKNYLFRAFMYSFYGSSIWSYY